MQEWPSEDWELQEYEISIKDFLVEMEPFQPWNFKKMTATLGNLKTLGNDLQKMSSLYAEQEELSHNDPEVRNLAFHLIFTSKFQQSHRTSSLPLRVNDKTPLQADPDPVSILMAETKKNVDDHAPPQSFLMDPHTVGYFYELQRLQMRYKSMQEDIFRAHKDLELERKRFAARQESYEKELKLHRQVLKETRETAKRKDVHF
jgi:hypothetical protein